jgi:hypothetical protein
MMSSSVRVTRSSGKKYYTCYDNYLCGSIMEHEMCHKCKNYFNDPNKKKQQHERGLRFACENPKDTGVELTSSTINRNQSSGKRKHTPVPSNTNNNSSNDDIIRPQKKTKHRVVVDQLHGMIRAHSSKLLVVSSEKQLLN